MKEGISICLTAWQTQDYIEQCLNSIEKQTYFKDFNDYEILLGIDHCEKTLNKVRQIQYKYRNLRVFYMDENYGTYITTNTMMAIAKYNWLLRVDSDDYILKHCVETLMDNASSDIGLVRFHLRNFKNIDNLLGKEKTWGQILLNKEVFYRYGGYMPWKCAADSELIERTKNYIKQITLDKVLYLRRLHPTSLIHNTPTKHGSELRNSYIEYIKKESPSNPVICTKIGDYTEIKPKEYNGEKGIISLTSWKARIKTVYKTLENLLEKCPEYHIVLCLSSDEFPDKEAELPLSIIRLLDRIEILWVKKNYKAFKKILFTIDKYKAKNVPVISADDDCLYKCNYADELYSKWQENPKDVIRYNMCNENDNFQCTQGPCSLYPPCTFNVLLTIKTRLEKNLIANLNQDDRALTAALKTNKIHISHVYRGHNFCFVFHDEISPINDNRKNSHYYTCYDMNENIKDLLIKDFTKRGFNFNIDNPQTIQEKIQWMKINDSTPLKTKCADKILVHEYCKEKLGKDICTPILKVYNHVDEIKLKELPDQFVLKCNHGCHYNIIVKDKSKLDFQAAKQKLATWKGRNFAYWYGYEMHYSAIDRKYFAEKYMNDGHDDLIDYKFLCFNGKPTYCQIISDRGIKELRRLNYYDMDFNFVDICRLEFPNNPNMLDEKPKNFELMKEYAKKLSEDFYFVRVDFYEIGDEVYLGELTFTPGSGYIKYKNPEDGLRLGKLLNLKLF